MAIAVNSGRHYAPARPRWVRRRATDESTPLAAFMMLLVLIGVAAFVLFGQVLDVSVPRTLFGAAPAPALSRPIEGAISTSKDAAAGATDQPAPAPAAEQPAPRATEAAPATSEPAVGARARIANTDGQGVVFYAAPRADARQPAGLLEGTTVTVLERSGEEWARVQSDTQKSGWVHSAYLSRTE